MVLGVIRLELALFGVTSLKEKRGILKPLLNRIRTRFEVAVAEIDHHDVWQSAAIGVCVVSNDPRHANQVLSAVVNFVESEPGPIELTTHAMELLHAL